MPQPPKKFNVFQFTKPYEYSYCVQYGGSGISGCTKWDRTNFSIGDTVIGHKSNTWVTGKLYGAGMNGSQGNIPQTVLKQVAFNVDAAQLSQYTQNVSTKSTKAFKPVAQSSEKPPIRTILIVVVSIIGILVILKLTNVI